MFTERILQRLAARGQFDPAYLYIDEGVPLAPNSTKVDP
jgi:hypothetical protein